MDEKEVERYETVDNNFEQTLQLREESQNTKFSNLKLEFVKASDLFGRIILYKLELLN
jgi:hypothetical protein